MSSDADLITEELMKADQQHDLGMKIGNSDIWIRCPFHGGGREKTPSLRITIDDGSSFFQKCKCMGCGWGPYHYNELAAHFGIAKTDKNFKSLGVKRLGFRDKLQKKTNIAEGRDYIRSTFDWPEDREWRTIPGKIVLKNKAVLTEVKHDLEEPRLAFPVSLWGEVKGWVYAMISDPRRDTDGNKIDVPYINSSGPWKEKCLFGYELARRLIKKYPDKPLWIVEGPRDVLHLQASGCIVVGCLGSSFSKEKAELIRMLNPHKILVATDNDEAGNKLAAQINGYLRHDIKLVRIKFKEGCDPVDTPRAKLKEINKRHTADYNDKTSSKIKHKRKILNCR